ncbi:hypothetical protein D3C77_407970 [compost metagenome]
MHADAVEQLGDLRTGKAPVGHRACGARWRGGGHAGDAVEGVLGGLGAALFKLLAVDDVHRRGGFPWGQAQAGAGLRGCVEQDAFFGISAAFDAQVGEGQLGLGRGIERQRAEQRRATG